MAISGTLSWFCDQSYKNITQLTSVMFRSRAFLGRWSRLPQCNIVFFTICKSFTCTGRLLRFYLKKLKFCPPSDNASQLQPYVHSNSKETVCGKTSMTISSQQSITSRTWQHHRNTKFHPSLFPYAKSLCFARKFRPKSRFLTDWSRKPIKPV